jgi:hypothetical protein
VVLGKGGVFHIAIAFFEGAFKFFVVHIANTLTKQERENVLFVISGVYGSTEGCGICPEVFSSSFWVIG